MEVASDAQPDAPNVSYDIKICSNSTVVFESVAELVDGTISHILNETGTSLNPMFTSSSFSVFGCDFDSRADMIPLGNVAPGQSVKVEYEMTVRVASAPFELGGLAAVGDPFDLSGSPGFDGGIEIANGVAVEASTWGVVKNLFRW